jgi:hypothetical protein
LSVWKFARGMQVTITASIPAVFNLNSTLREAAKCMTEQPLVLDFTVIMAIAHATHIVQHIRPLVTGSFPAGLDAPNIKVSTIQLVA